jgi:hypothetical protein
VRSALICIEVCTKLILNKSKVGREFLFPTLVWWTPKYFLEFLSMRFLTKRRSVSDFTKWTFLGVLSNWILQIDGMPMLSLHNFKWSKTEKKEIWCPVVFLESFPAVYCTRFKSYIFFVLIFSRPIYLSPFVQTFQSDGMSPFLHNFLLFLFQAISFYIDSNTKSYGHIGWKFSKICWKPPNYGPNVF